MKRSAILITISLLLLLGAGAALLSLGMATPAAAYGSAQPFTVPEPAGNQCVGCHTAADPLIGQAIAWPGPAESLETISCPALRKAQEELYLTDRLLLAIQRNRETLPAWVSTAKLDRKLRGQFESYARLSDLPVTSLGAQVSEVQTLRYQLGKLYTQVNALRSQATVQTVFAIAALVSLTILAALVYGLFLTRRFSSGGARGRGSAWAIGLVLLLIFAFFALPLFQTPAAEVAAATDLEAERQTRHDEASRAADAAERAQSRIWMLGEVGAAWQALDPAQAQSAFEQTLALAEEARLESIAVWGASRGAQDYSAGDIQAQEQAAIIASEADAMRSRAWGLRAAAEAWLPVDPTKAERLLTAAEKTASGALEPYRSYDLRTIALAWAKIDPARASALMAQVQDPAIRAWGFRELGDDAAAGAAARLIANPLRQADSLAQLALASGQAEYFADAYAALQKERYTTLTASQFSYAISRLAALSGNAELVNEISPNYPAARALAQLGLGQAAAAWETSQQIADPYEQAHLQARIAAELGDASLAETIRIPVLADAALRDIIQKTGTSSLIDRTDSVYYKVQNLTKLGEFSSAWERANLADEPLSESAPLVSLACGWSQSDAAAAAQVVEQLTREADKAIALRCIAAATGAQDDFERALGMALAARVRDDATAPVRASLNLAKVMLDKNAVENAGAAFQQAYESALRISVK